MHGANHCDGVDAADLAVGDAERLRDDGEGDGRVFLGVSCGASLRLGPIVVGGVGVGVGVGAADSSSCSDGLLPLDAARCISRVHCECVWGGGAR